MRLAHLQVSFDPLDGSSILEANFAVGTIFGIWPTPSLVGCSGRQQCAAAYAVYGPQTILVWARPKAVPAGQLESHSGGGHGASLYGSSRHSLCPACPVVRACPPPPRHSSQLHPCKL